MDFANKKKQLSLDNQITDFTFLLCWELSESEELSDPLEDEELEPDEELFDELELEAEMLPFGRGLGGISENAVVISTWEMLKSFLNVSNKHSVFLQKPVTAHLTQFELVSGKSTNLVGQFNCKCLH